MTDCARLFNIGRRAAGIALALLAVVAAWAGPAAVTARAQDLSYGPIKGMVTMIDLGATECVPCKMMAPILVKLKKVYEGKAAIIFIDVWKNNDPARQYGIRAIPTQIFFDAGGREVHRHIGFMSEKEIVEQLTRMGVN